MRLQGLLQGSASTAWVVLGLQGNVCSPMGLAATLPSSWVLCAVHVVLCGSADEVLV